MYTHPWLQAACAHECSVSCTQSCWMDAIDWNVTGCVQTFTMVLYMLCNRSNYGFKCFEISYVWAYLMIGLFCTFYREHVQNGKAGGLGRWKRQHKDGSCFRGNYAVLLSECCGCYITVSRALVVNCMCYVSLKLVFQLQRLPSSRCRS